MYRSPLYIASPAAPDDLGTAYSGPARAISFCGHCGARDAKPPQRARVCEACGLGLMLSAALELAPRAEEPFLVLDAGLTVCAVSLRAEELLGVTEHLAVNRHMTELLIPAEASDHRSEDSLAAAVSRAAHEAGVISRATVRPARTFGIRYGARIGRCGPIPSALLVFDDIGQPSPS